MTRWLLAGLVVLAFAVGWQAPQAEAQTDAMARFASGHGDLIVAYDAATHAWAFAVEVGGGTVDGVPGVEGEFAAANIRIVIPLKSREERPENVPALLNFDPIGVAAGEMFWKLPQT